MGSPGGLGGLPLPSGHRVSPTPSSCVFPLTGKHVTQVTGKTFLEEERDRGRAGGDGQLPCDPVKARPLALLAGLAEGTRANPALGQLAPRKAVSADVKPGGTLSISLFAFAARKQSHVPDSELKA